MILDFLKLKTPPLIGVDMGSSAVKIVELSRDGLNFSLERYAVEPLPNNAASDAGANDTDALAVAVRRAWERSGSHIKNVAIALPAAAVITRVFSVPSGLSEHALEVQAETEASQYIPFPLDEINLDFQVLGASANTFDEDEVLLAAARKDKIDERLAVIEAAGLKACVVDVECFATQAALELVCPQLPNWTEKQTVAIIDIGAAATNVDIFKDKRSIYSREHAYAGNQLTQEIQNRFNLSFEAAEQAKRQKGTLPKEYQQAVLEPFMDTLVLEISRSLQFFYTSSSYSSVDHIVLAGGCSVIEGLDKAISERTKVSSTLRANPFLNMVTNKVRGHSLSLEAPSLFTACGLAMRRFDPT